MCLITNNKPIVINEDMTVYKIVKATGDVDTFQSEIQCFTYQKGKLYQTDLTDDGENVCYDTKAISDLESWRPNWSFNTVGLISWNEGFHAFTYDRIPYIFKDIKTDLKPFAHVLVECKIPKGSKVVISEANDLLVSDQIIVQQVVDYQATIAKIGARTMLKYQVEELGKFYFLIPTSKVWGYSGGFAKVLVCEHLTTQSYDDKDGIYTDKCSYCGSLLNQSNINQLSVKLI